MTRVQGDGCTSLLGDAVCSPHPLGVGLKGGPDVARAVMRAPRLSVFYWDVLPASGRVLLASMVGESGAVL